MRLPCAVAMSLLVTLSHGARSQDAIAGLPSRIEIRSFESLTMSDQEFLLGQPAGRRVVLSGELRLPQSAETRAPAVIQLHGSGGINAGNDEWSRLLNRVGIATFLVDSFSARQIVSTAADQSQLGRLNMIIDAYRAREMLATHPRIDPARIALMGSSRGGQSALYASFRRFQRSWGNNTDFAAYIPLYAPCDTPEVMEGTDVSSNPIRMFHGETDNWVPVAPCRALVQRLKAVGKDITLTEFADTWHQFDNPLGPGAPRRAANAQTMRSCRLREEPKGVVINSDTGKPFSYNDACVERGPSLAFNRKARDATQQAAVEFLRATFGLK